MNAQYHNRTTVGKPRALTWPPIDRWQDEQAWRSFLNAFGPDYESLDSQLDGLAVAERSMFEGSS